MTVKELTSRELLAAWCERARGSCEAHYRIASSKMNWNGVLALGVVVTSTFVGSTMFVMMGNSLDVGWRWALALVSLVTALLAGLQRTLRLAENGEKHRVAGARWDSIFNRICRLSTRFGERDEVPDEELQKIEVSMDKLVQESPYIPERWFKKVRLGKTYPSCKDCKEK